MLFDDDPPRHARADKIFWKGFCRSPDEVPATLPELLTLCSNTMSTPTTNSNTMSAPTTNSTATDNDQLPPVAPVQKCTKCAIERDVSWFLSQVPGKTNRQCRACLDRDASYKKKRV
jgi:hypothetical protein